MLKSLLSTGGSSKPPYSDDLFAATAYGVGQGAKTTGVNLLENGGLLWIKKRSGGSAASSHLLFDSVRGASRSPIRTDSANAETGNYGVSFTNTGFSLATSTDSTTAGTPFAYSFVRHRRFFDVVTWVGDGTTGARTIPHGLSRPVGLIAAKSLSVVGDFHVWHASTSSSFAYGLKLNTTGRVQDFGVWGTPPYPMPTDSFSVKGDLNRAGVSYIAYVWADDSSADGIVKAGIYTGGSTSQVTLGWQPQACFIKRSSEDGQNWFLVDSTRGSARSFYPNLAANDGGDNVVSFNATGFVPNSTINAANTQNIYLAIRSPNKPASA